MGKQTEYNKDTNKSSILAISRTTISNKKVVLLVDAKVSKKQKKQICSTEITTTEVSLQER